MGLFGKKTASTTDEVDSSNALSDAKYREELRALGRDEFKKIIAKQADHMEKEIDEMMERVAGDVKVHASRKVDALMGRLNAEVTNQINERMKEYNRVSGEAQELVAQSLSRNAQMVHEKYQQLSLDLQRAIADQEVMMATVFEDSKTQIATIQSEQANLLEQLREKGSTVNAEVEGLVGSLRQSVNDQANKLHEVYQENTASVEKTRQSQSEMLNSLTQTTKALESQYEQLSELLDKSIVDQKTMVAEVINDNMARIVEHYLIGALGEQSNLREQLPSIIEQMEQSKQAMVDDMKL